MEFPPRQPLQIVMPVHNEAKTIEGVLQEIHTELSRRFEVEFILSEDGSKDGTTEVLQRLSARIPIRLVTDVRRKGYAQAVLDGFRLASTPQILFLDSDGQYVPSDFWDLHRFKGEYDLVVGWRVRRMDTLVRRTMSTLFGILHWLLFRVPIHDPSCSFVLMDKRLLDRLLPDLAILSEGFWWEFTARAHKLGFSIKEVPVRHRLRASGKSRVFGAAEIPRIARENVAGLFRVWRDVRRKGDRRTTSKMKDVL